MPCSFTLHTTSEPELVAVSDKGSPAVAMYAARLPRHLSHMRCRQMHAVPLAIAMHRAPAKKTTSAAAAAAPVALPTARAASSAGFPNQCRTGGPSHFRLHHRARSSNGKKVESLCFASVSGGAGPGFDCNSEATVAGNRRQLGRGRASMGRALSVVVKAPGGLGRGASTTGKGNMRRMMSTSMPEREFHLVADGALENIHDAVEEALEEGFDDDFDCNLSVSRILPYTWHLYVGSTEDTRIQSSTVGFTTCYSACCTKSASWLLLCVMSHHRECHHVKKKIVTTTSTAVYIVTV